MPASDERDRFADAQTQAFADFDKTVLTLASGALALSLIFVHDVAPKPAVDVGWLIGSWALFAFSLVTVLSSFVTSQFAHEFAIRQIDNDERDAVNHWRRWTWGLNLTSATALVLGVVTLIVFAASNV